MTEYELTSLIYDLFRDMDAMVEFWITATFAVVVAVFVGRKRLTRRLLNVVVVLYLAASLQFAMRWGLLLYRAMHYRQRLVEQTGSDIPTSEGLIAVVSLLIMFVFVIGTVAAVLFLRRHHDEAAGGKAPD